MSRCPEFRRPALPCLNWQLDDNAFTPPLVEPLGAWGAPARGGVSYATDDGGDGGGAAPADPPADVHAEAANSSPASGPPQAKLAEAHMTVLAAAPRDPEEEHEEEEYSACEDVGDAEVGVDEAKENLKSIAVTMLVVLFWGLVLGPCHIGYALHDVSCEGDAERRRKVCEPCGRGTRILPLFGDFERSWPTGLLIVLYFVGLLWIFQGIGLVCDQFMSAIEEITSRESEIWVEVRPGMKRLFTTQTWNDTVANLTLMALGSSAPEILLNVVEICLGDFFAGELGPSTIVGSAAFNLLIITAVCVSSLPVGEVRKVEGTRVFAVTATISVLAYVWLILILQVFSPDRVDILEALLTLSFFPLLVLIAFLADKGYFCFGWQPPRIEWNKTEDMIRKQYGSDLTSEALDLMLRERKRSEAKLVPSRSIVRKAFVDSLTGSKRQSTQTFSGLKADGSLQFGFARRKISVIEGDGFANVKVIATRVPSAFICIKYATVEGSAKEGVRYKQTSGELIFRPFQLEAVIKVPIIDNDIFDHDEEFQVRLFDLEVLPSPKGRVIGVGSPPTPKLFRDVAEVTVINDDMPGTLDFDTELAYVKPGQRASIGVMRTSGCTGRISCSYKTVDDTAIAGRDFDFTTGVLTFEADVAHQSLEIPIRPAREGKPDEGFLVILYDATDGAVFDAQTNGGSTQAICKVMIPGNIPKTVLKKVANVMYKLKPDWESLGLYREQFEAAFFCNGGPAEQAEATVVDWVFHALSLFWKVLVAFIPPPALHGGWLCFWSALLMIGVVTLLVGEMASLLGCVLGIPDDITAITLVALGTSLPDTFASKVAAQQNPTADDCIGNVTGSNCVNVFLGLGLPWTIGSLYWNGQGRTTEWDNRVYRGKTLGEMFGDTYPSGGFMVPATGLSFSVTVFALCAAVCLSLLVIRRVAYGGELGGQRAQCWRDSGILLMLWFVYIGASVVFSSTQES